MEMESKRDPKGAATAREAGNTSYKKGKWAEAIGHYAQSARLDPTDPAPLLNRAQAYIKLEKWQDVIRDCNTVLALPNHSTNVKALFRRSLARREISEEDGAVEDLEMVLKLEPGNSAAKEELSNLKQAMKKRQKKERRTASVPEDSDSKATIPPLSLEPGLTKRFNRSPEPTSKSTAATPVPPQGICVPIKIVPTFSPRPVRASSSVPATAELPAPSSSNATPAIVEGFAEKKAERGNKKGFTGKAPGHDADAKVDVRSVGQQDTAGRSVRVEPPVSGLNLIDRVMSADADVDRWDILTSLPSTKIGTWLDPLIEPDHLAAIYQAILSRVTAGHAQDAKLASDLVTALQSMKRWKMVQGMLSRKEKEDMYRVLRWCEAT